MTHTSRHPVSRRAGTDFRVQNLFDANYAYSEGFPEPGRNFVLNMRYKF